MYKITKLKNNLTLITAPMTGTKTITVLVMVGTGSKYETKKEGGISHFLEHLFFKGTAKRPNTLAISGELDGVGAEFNAFTSKEYTGYFVKMDSRKLPLALDVVSDMLLNSKFDSREIEREKGVIIEELNMYLDNPMMHIEDVYEQCLYGDTPAGRDTIGTKSSILSFKRKDFLDYLSAQYNVNNTAVILTGNLGKNEKAIKVLVDKYFGSKKFSARGRGFKEKLMVKEEQLKPAVKLEYKKTDQAHLVLGVRAYSYDHNDRIIIKLLAIILGGSMSSRLFINLRERQGLCYYVRTDSEAYSDSGYLATRAGVPVSNIKKAIKIILKEYKNLKNSLVPAKELKRAKEMLRGRTAIQFEISDNLANWYGRQAVLEATVKRAKGKAGNKPDITTPEEHVREINKISAVDLRRVARDIFVNKGINLAAIGPFRDGGVFEKLLKL